MPAIVGEDSLKGKHVRKFRVTAGFVAAMAVALLAGCGGHGSGGTANVRVVNATLSYSSLALLANSSTAISSTAIDTVSGYSGVPSGSTTLQLDDATTGTALTTTTPSLTGDQHYAMLAYEGGGTVRTALISEDTTAPSSGTVYLRVFDAATDSGAVDVYVTDPSTDLSTISSPTVSFGASTTVQASGYFSFVPGTYRIRVTGSGNTADLRLDIPSVTLTDQQLATAILTPTTGGTLANGSVLVQQGAYTAARNTNARVRLAAAVSNNAVVSALAGSTTISPGVVAPAIGSYVLVPGGSAFNISVNGASVGAPLATLAAGSDTTLIVYGNASAPTASLITDDNHLPAAAASLKIRLLNGVTGAATTLSATANFGVVATNVAPGSASSYTVVASSTQTTHLEVTGPSGNVNISPYSDIYLPASAVYTLFVLGDASAPVPVLRRDR
jgi:hypothetical protein